MRNTVNILLIKENKLLINLLGLVRHEICCIACSVSILWAASSWDIKLYTHRKCMSGKTHLQFLDHGYRRVEDRRYDRRQIDFSCRGCMEEANFFAMEIRRIGQVVTNVVWQSDTFKFTLVLIAEPRGNQLWTYGNCRRHQLRFSRQNRRQRMC